MINYRSAAYAVGFATATFGLAICSPLAMALDSVQEQSSVVEKTTVEGNPTVIQHIDSKMEPTVVQSRVSTDPATGEKQKVTEPIIMERHDKVLDTTIIQPEMTETKTTTRQVNKSDATPVLSNSSKRSVTSKPRLKHLAVRKQPSTKHLAYHARSVVRPTHSVNQFSQTTEVIRQPVIKETIIQNNSQSAPQDPQVIQKIDSH